MHGHQQQQQQFPGASPYGAPQQQQQYQQGYPQQQHQGQPMKPKPTGDALDRFTSKALNKIAPGNQKLQKAETVEAVSDGLRKLYKKTTGKKLPISDKTYQ